MEIMQLMKLPHFVTLFCLTNLGNRGKKRIVVARSFTLLFSLAVLKRVKSN